MQEPTITFLKERIGKKDEHLHCCLCMYGMKAGIILWRVEFRGEMHAFHWLICNRCRFLIFKAMGGKRINRSADWKQLLAKPKQKVSDKGKVRISEYYAMSWDRRAAIDHGIPLHAYAKSPESFDLDTGKVIKKKKRKRKGLL